jgi:cytochrome c5
MRKSIVLTICALVFTVTAACNNNEEAPPPGKDHGPTQGAPLTAPEGKEETMEYAAEVTGGETGEETYALKCVTCHATGISGAPILGDKAAWEARIARGMATLYSHTINGFEGASGVMPAKGGFPELTDEQVKAAVDYMVEKSR